MTDEPLTEAERDDLLNSIRLILNSWPDARMLPRALKSGADMRDMAWLARSSGCNRTALFRSMKVGANPTLRTLNAILRAFGLRLNVERQWSHRDGGSIAGP